MIVFHLFSFVTNIYLVEFSDYGETLTANYSQVFFGQATPYIPIILSILTFFGLIYVQRAISICILTGYFNVRSANKFRKAGLFLFLSGGLGMIFDLILFWKSKGATHFGNLGMGLFMLIIAFSLYIIAEVIENGTLLPQDNELNI